jgi:hypothetical protein
MFAVWQNEAVICFICLDRQRSASELSGLGAGFWVWVQVSGFGCGSLGLGAGLWVWVRVSGLRVRDFGLRVQVSGFGSGSLGLGPGLGVWVRVFGFECGSLG